MNKKEQPVKIDFTASPATLSAYDVGFRNRTRRGLEAVPFNPYLEATDEYRGWEEGWRVATIELEAHQEFYDKDKPPCHR